MQGAKPYSGRRQVRVERTVAQVVQVEDGMGFPIRNHQAKVEDIGVGGIGLTMRCGSIRGDRLRLVLSDPASRQPMRFTAIVRWRGGDHFGLQWIGLTAEQQSWLRSLLRSWAGEPAVPLTRSRGYTVSPRT